MACGRYRSISLLNVDTKLQAKVLYHRLLPHISQLVHFDQVGFIPHREARDNTTMERIVKRSASPAILISTDAEKTFDRVDWLFSHKKLKHIGRGPRMLHWILSSIFRSLCPCQNKWNTIKESVYCQRYKTRLPPLPFDIHPDSRTLSMESYTESRYYGC